MHRNKKVRYRYINVIDDINVVGSKKLKIIKKPCSLLKPIVIGVFRLFGCLSDCPSYIKHNALCDSRYYRYKRHSPPT